MVMALYSYGAKAYKTTDLRHEALESYNGTGCDETGRWSCDYVFEQKLADMGFKTDKATVEMWDWHISYGILVMAY